MKSSIRPRTDTYALDYMGIKLTQRSLDELQSHAIRNYVSNRQSAYSAAMCAAVDMLISLGYLETVQGPDGSTVLAAPKPRVQP